MGRRKRNLEGASQRAHVRVKLHVGGDAIGPGKIELLRHIDRHGGISAAAREMGITFRRAWYLIDTMHSVLGASLVETEVGGTRGGGARLTDLGRDLVKQFDTMNARVAPAAKPLLRWLGCHRTNQR